MATLENALDILFLFNDSRKMLSAADISADLQLPLSTTYKYLKVLQSRDFIMKDADNKKYSLGWTIFQIGNRKYSGIKLENLALTEMKALQADCLETILLTVLSGQQAHCVEKVASTRLIKIGHERGGHHPVHVGASGRILLAYQSSSFQTEYLSQATFVETNTTSRLIEQLECIRRQGHAFSDSELDSGSVAVSAPIFNHAEQLVAGLTVAGLKDRLVETSLNLWTTMVKERARNISRILGCPDDFLKNSLHTSGAVAARD